VKIFFNFNESFSHLATNFHIVDGKKNLNCFHKNSIITLESQLYNWIFGKSSNGKLIFSKMIFFFRFTLMCLSSFLPIFSINFSWSYWKVGLMGNILNVSWFNYSWWEMFGLGGFYGVSIHAFLTILWIWITFTDLLIN
jgi:hypothetical protein